MPEMHGERHADRPAADDDDLLSFCHSDSSSTTRLLSTLRCTQAGGCPGA